MVILRPKNLKKCCFDTSHPSKNGDVVPGFIIHPSTSDLASRLQIDPEFLSKENYSGIYDEAGDYIPQYCDDPEKIPQGGLTANQETSTPANAGTAGGAEGPSDSSSTTDASPES